MMTRNAGEMCNDGVAVAAPARTRPMRRVKVVCAARRRRRRQFVSHAPTDTRRALPDDCPAATFFRQL